jgi:lupus La protein
MTDNVENTPVATETPAVAAVEAPAAAAEAPVTEVAAPASVATTSTTDAPVVNKDEEKAKILKQVEFYFSDSNLPVDKFLSELVSKAKDGCTYATTPLRSNTQKHTHYHHHNLHKHTPPDTYADTQRNITNN